MRREIRINPDEIGPDFIGDAEGNLRKATVEEQSRKVLVPETKADRIQLWAKKVLSRIKRWL